MTFLEFQSKVQRLTKTSTRDAALVSLTKDAINVALYDVAREQKWPELLTVRHELDLATAVDGTPITVPTDFIELERVKYSSGNYKWRLFPVGSVLPPQLVPGKPREYQLVSGNPISIVVDPYTAIVAEDQLLIDYYKAPAELVADGDEPS